LVVEDEINYNVDSRRRDGLRDACDDRRFKLQRYLERRVEFW
jgi:hypothetical protein